MCIKTIGELHLVRHYRCSAPNCTSIANLRRPFSEKFIMLHITLRGCVVALLVERRTGDQEVVSSSLSRAHGVKTLGKFLTPMCLCHRSPTLDLRVGTYLYLTFTPPMGVNRKASNFRATYAKRFRFSTLCFV